MKSARFGMAVILSGCLHAAVLGLLCLATPREKPAKSLPVLLVAFGDSDREGVAVGTVARNPGTLRRGDQHTPGGDGVPQGPAPRPAPVTVPPARPSAVQRQPTAPRPKPRDAAAVAKPGPRPAVEGPVPEPNPSAHQPRVDAPPPPPPPA